MRLIPILALTFTLGGSALVASHAPVEATVRAAKDEVVQVFDQATIHWDENQPEIKDPDGFVVRHAGHTVERSLDLPARPTSHRDDQRIVAVVNVMPIYSTIDGRQRPNDPWTRLGNISIVTPDPGGGPPLETELLRFVTGYGGPGQFEQDVTPFAPLLHDRATLRAFLSSYSDDPGWMISLELRYSNDGVGQRRPALAERLFLDAHVTWESATLRGEVTIPEGLDPPRIRVITTGHATDGQAENEFVTCTHSLRIDGRVVAKWRPWSERGGPLRDRNPRSGRSTVDGREIRASDLDRSGWNPGLIVEPYVIPVPELTAGTHQVELRISGIRRHDPPTETGRRHHGYWVVSATILADETWPDDDSSAETPSDRSSDTP